MPDQTLNHAMLMKIRDMEMVMGFSQTHRDRAVAFADEAFSNTSDGVEMIEYVEGEEIFLSGDVLPNLFEDSAKRN